MKLRRMCGGAMRPWRCGWRAPRWERHVGAVIIDNLGIAIVYAPKRGDW